MRLVSLYIIKYNSQYGNKVCSGWTETSRDRESDSRVGSKILRDRLSCVGRTGVEAGPGVEYPGTVAGNEAGNIPEHQTEDWRGSFSSLSIFTLYSWKVCWTDIDPWYPGLTWKRVEFLKKSFLYIISFYFLKFHRKALWFIRQNNRYSSINVPFIPYKFFQK